MGSRTEDVTARVLANPKYHQLVRKRNAISLAFFAVMLVVYAGFILTLAFVPELFARPIGAGFTTSIFILRERSRLKITLSIFVQLRLSGTICNRFL